MTKRKAGEGRAPHAKNPHAVALGKLSFKAKFAGLTPEEVSAEQARRSGYALFTAVEKAAIKAKKQATWRAKRVAYLKAEAQALAEEVARQHQQADEEGLPRERTARTPDAS